VNLTVALAARRAAAALAAVVPTWVTDDQVAAALGLELSTLTAADQADLTGCVEAANAFVFRRRAAGGYTDDPATVPGPDTARAVVAYAVALWRERGSVDSFASFADFPPSPVTGSMGQILRLAGIPRPVAV
jgi:hypothetical protein